MPSVDLILEIRWRDIEINEIEDSHRDPDTVCYVSAIDEFSLAEHLEDGIWPAGLRQAIYKVMPKPYTSEIQAFPVDGEQRARYFAEKRKDIEGALKAWKIYTLPLFHDALREKNPDVKGLPFCDDPQHLVFSAKILMQRMKPEEVHDVLYSDDYYLDYWDWRQLLLYHLRPHKISKALVDE